MSDPDKGLMIVGQQVEPSITFHPGDPMKEVAKVTFHPGDPMKEVAKVTGAAALSPRPLN